MVSTMAALKFARISKGEGKKWDVIMPDGVKVSHESAELAATACQTINDGLTAAAEAKANAPITTTVTSRGQFQVYGSRNVNGEDVGGKFPFINLTGKQFELLMANWATVVEEYTARKSDVCARWQDLPASTKTAKA